MTGLSLLFSRSSDKLTDAVGGPARRKAVFFLAAVLSLSSADVGAVSALAPQLESAFRVGNAGIGLLVTASTLIAAVATLPFGVLTDRMSRTRILSISIVVWGTAELLSGFAPSFVTLLIIRVALGAVTATAGPAVASLTGDLFPAAERSRIYGMILTGELLGGGLGVVAAGDIGAAVSWRVGLAVLALPSVVLAWAIHRYFPEPARGGQSRLYEGAEEIASAEEVAADPDAYQITGDDGQEVDPLAGDPLVAVVDESGVEPDESLIVDAEVDLGLWEVVRWVLRVPTNVSLIVASCFGYFFLSGLRTFALIYARGRFDIGQGVATVLFVLIGAAAVVGALVSGRYTDRLIHGGRPTARLVVGGVGFLVAAVVFVPGLLSSSLILALPLFLVASFALSAPNPAIDAARLDVVPSQMWGRAESIRTTIRTLLEALAPLVFGLVSSVFGGASAGFGSGVNPKGSHISKASTIGLEYTFLIMLVTLAASGILLLRSRRHYLTDVASAVASERTRQGADQMRAGGRTSSAGAGN